MPPLLSASRLPRTSVEPLGLASVRRVEALSDWDDDVDDDVDDEPTVYEPEADDEWTRPSKSHDDWVDYRYQESVDRRRFGP